MANGNENGASASAIQYHFDDFVIDPANREVRRDGVAMPLRGKVFDVLLVFAENPARLLSKDELLEKVWKSDFVEEGNLARNISTLRKALGDTGKEHKYIATIPGHGYRFVADVLQIDKDSRPETAISDPVVETHRQSRRWVLLIAIVTIALTIAWLGTQRFFTPTQSIRSLAVLPLKRTDGGDNYLGIGIADAVIRKISQTRQLVVRPTGAVLRYANSDVDTLSAAKELNTDAALEGIVQSSGDRLRISVNLLRTADGASLWTDNFDMPAADIFAVQDKVAQQVAAHLRLHIDASQTATTGTKYPANAAAYEFYIKGIFSLDQRGYKEQALPQMRETIDFFNKSLEADPDYALAHAQLAWAYAWTAQFIDASDVKWADLARQEIRRADELDSDIAETHLAKAMLFWSRYENYQYDAVIRELLIARQLNPSTTHGELAGIIGHLGLDDRASDELKLALEADPASQSLKDLTLILPFLRGDPDGWLQSRQNLPSDDFKYVDPWYYMRKGDLENAKKAIDEREPQGGKYPEFLMIQALYSAQMGNFSEAESKVPAIVDMLLPGSQNRHHVTYNAACIFALAGDSREAVKWLRETAATGFPDYPLFARDQYLDRIRKSPEFVKFISEQQVQWERFRQEIDE